MCRCIETSLINLPRLGRIRIKASLVRALAGAPLNVRTVDNHILAPAATYLLADRAHVSITFSSTSGAAGLRLAGRC
jgi:hypothetical protein